VIRTDPAVGEGARSGSVIDAIVSSGPQLFAVPNVQGATVAAATGTLQEAGFTIGATEEVFSGEIDQGLVVGTNPTADSAQRAGTPLTLIVSRGLEPVVLPNMGGLPTADAQFRLSNLGLLSTVRQQFSDAAATGTVITTEPGTGATLVPGDTVTVVASKGPAPSVVPDVVGMGQQEAVAALQAAGLQPATRNQLPIVVLDRVYSQDPAAGTELPRGSTVTITIV
jgi:serine/threonine-protein kinase